MTLLSLYALAAGGISPTVIGVIIAALGLLFTAAGIAGGSWRISRNTQTVALYKDTAEAWEAKSKSQDARIAELEEAEHRKDREISELRGQVATLQDLVTGRSALQDMDERLAAGIAQSAKILQVVQGIATDLAVGERT
jgi:hypothetical protein